MANQSIADLPATTPTTLTESVYLPPTVPAPVPTTIEPSTPTLGEQVVNSAPVTVTPTAARRPRPATGAVPDAARTRTPTRSPAELLAQARRVTADWSDAELSGERIRKALHTSAVNGRSLRDVLQRQRAAHQRPGLHVVEDQPDTIGTPDDDTLKSPATRAN